MHPLKQFDEIVKKRKQYDFRYYIRIYNNDDDVKNIQYSILLLQQFKSILGKLQFFIVPFDNYYQGKEISWKGINTYYKYSHFLRFILLSYKEFFWGAYFNHKKSRVEIRHLSSKKVGIQSTFFPLLEINDQNLCIITDKFLLEEKQNRSVMISDLLQISDKILSGRLKACNEKRVVEEKIKEMKQNLSDRLVTILEYAIFCVLIPEKGMISEEIILGSMEEACNIAGGLVQLMENIVLHSYNKKGIFTFRVTGNNTKQIEIDISDANFEETILDNFKKKLEDGEDYFANITLNISHFFEKYTCEEEKQAWKNYRHVNPAKCLGLQRLANELKRCAASFKVRSNTSYSKNIDELYYIVLSRRDMQSKNDLYIPGTQYQISIPIAEKYNVSNRHNANVFLNAVGGLIETDAIFAKFVDYQQIDISFEDLCVSQNNIEAVDRYFYNNSKDCKENRKERMVDFWCDGWNIWTDKKKISEEGIYCLDITGIRNLISPWGIEAFCKGLIRSNVLRNEHMKYFALINASEELMKMFFETIQLTEVQWNEKLQLYIHIDNNNDDIVITGRDRNEITRNAYQYCFIKGKIPSFLSGEFSGEIEQTIELCPFDTLLKQKESDKTLFENYIENVADELLTSEKMAGYKLQNSHMRLGNKVHLNEFYELSILFRKPFVSKKIALLIIRRMIDENVNIRQNILFYGYASYSRTILISLVEIMKEYHRKRKIENCFIDFAIYQNDIMIQKTLIDISPKVQMYFSGKMPQNENVKIVQIVPISTTLTTFKKMWDMFCEELTTENQYWNLEKNYTLFWVRDNGEANEPTEIEEEYWSKIEKRNTIVTDLIKPSPQFFCFKKTKWFNPLNCEQCYPKNILDEISLIETDVTSTVPSLQLEVTSDNVKLELNKDLETEYNNEHRVIELKDCVYYGHISRDGNHFQYYIDTVAYFQKQKAEIAEWLKEKSISDGKDITGNGELNIIVTPHHHTNVEYGRYVNEYYFQGTADIITIDSAKEYRSNVIIKYADIKETISNAYRLKRNVQFVYVDDTIITGTTFKRVNNLLHSLVPEKRRDLLQVHKVFVLVNRLSGNSKLDYVRNTEHDFYAFVNLNISSIRNFGDSCTMCTLQKNSKLFHKRASTSAMAKYWDDKQYNYRAISFDKYNDKSKIQQGYIRMLCSHYAKSNLYITEDMVSSICSIANLMLKLRNNEETSPIYKEVLLENKEEAVRAYLKVLVRPFFSYGRIYRQAIMDLLLLITEYFLNPFFGKQLKQEQRISEKKIYMNDQKLRTKVLLLCQFLDDIIPEEERLEFIQKYLLEGLTDLRSNYIIRKSTLKNFYNIIKGKSNLELQYDIYCQMVYRLINSSADETKSLWLEYLLTTGQENKGGMNKYEKLKLDAYWDQNDDFQKFLVAIFIENTRLCYDSMLNFVTKANSIIAEKGESEADSMSEAVSELWGDYYIRNLRRFIRIEILVESSGSYDNGSVEEKIQSRTEKMTRLLWLLKKETKGGLERYDKLRCCAEQILYKNDQLSIFTMAEGELCPVTDYKKGMVLQENSMELKKIIGNEDFQKKGFYIGSDFIIISVSNRGQYHKKQIQPLYFYVQCEDTSKYQKIVRVRKILMYRNQILHWIEADFNNNALSVLVEQMSVNRQLIRDKAGDHSSRTDILSIERLLQTKYDSKHHEKLYQWMLLRQYVNLRIARRFRSEWSKDSEETRDRLYTLQKNSDEVNGPMINLGRSFFETRLDRTSSAHYLELIFDMFEFTVCIDGKTTFCENMNTMENLFNQLNGREENGYYYKQEYIICIILDIMFSAIRTCRNWKNDYDMHLEQLGDWRRLIKENEMMTCFERLSSDDGKCRMRIDKESSFLIFRNIVEGMRESEVEMKNQEMKKQFRTKETKGLSLQTIKWYVENLGSAVTRHVSFRYEWNNEIGKVEFVTKLPILKEEEIV